jgi:hypothetical protein
MYGQAGLKETIRRQKKAFHENLKMQHLVNQKQVESLRDKVKAYESLQWYQKLWLAVRELFGYKKAIL